MQPRVLSVVLVSSALCLGACSSDLVEPERIQGLFDLIYVGDAHVPAFGAPSAGCPLLIDHGSIALDSNGRFSAVIDAGTALCANGDSIPAAYPDAGTYEIVGDSIVFQPDGVSPAYSGTFVGGESFLEVHHSRGTYTYFRYR